MRQHGRVLVVALLALMYLPIAALHGHPELLDAATKAFQQIPAGVHSQLIELPAALELDDGARRKLWKSFRNHRAKTAWLNPAFESRIRGAFPTVSREEAKKISQVGPSPDDLEITKQRAFYSECYGGSDGFVAHCPSIAEWRDLAWDRMWEAKALATGMRDHTPQELEVWREHFTAASKAGEGIATVMPRLHDVLLERKLIQEGWWKTLLEDLAFETEQSGMQEDHTNGCPP